MEHNGDQRPGCSSATLGVCFTEGCLRVSFRVSLEIQSNQARNFESTFFQYVCQILAVNKTRWTPCARNQTINETEILVCLILHA